MRGKKNLIREASVKRGCTVRVCINSVYRLETAVKDAYECR